jgi:HAD superfamily hydrolase (TIGR01509 family)
MGANSLKAVNTVIFDCDGVMFDSRISNTDFYNHLLGHFNQKPLSEEDADYVHMHTADASIRHIFRGTPHIQEALYYRMKMDYGPFIQAMVPEPGLKELLEALAPRYHLAVATNRSNTIHEVLTTHGLADYFELVVSSLDVQRPKPHPEALMRIIDRFKTAAERSLYVGDSPVDLETARAAAVPFVAYKNQGLQADFHTNHLLEIARLLGI